MGKKFPFCGKANDIVLFQTVRFDNIAVIDMDDRLVGNPPADKGQIRFRCFLETPFFRCLVRHSTELTFWDFSWS